MVSGVLKNTFDDGVTGALPLLEGAKGDGIRLFQDDVW